MRMLARAYKIYTPDSAYATEQLAAARAKLARGEEIRVVGIGAGGHNSGVGLVTASFDKGIRVVANHEEERFLGIKHFKHYPRMSIGAMLEQMAGLGLGASDIDAVVMTWNYVRLSAQWIRSIAEEAPRGFELLRRGALPPLSGRDVAAAFNAPKLLARQFGSHGRIPIVGLRHHDNHAWFSFGVSPFARDAEPVMVAVIDGTGDDGSISLYLARDGRLALIYGNESIFDSLGQMYMYISSTQGGWPPLSSEGRYMGASAWGDQDRRTNTFYRRLRNIFHLAADGRVLLNRALANWHRAGIQSPYTSKLVEILGPPIAPDDMWNPDAVLRVDDIEHHPFSRKRVDKAAATQLVFEDALFHVIDNLIRRTGSTKLVLTGGVALNCVANMRLLERYDTTWYRRNLRTSGRLHLWVPPVPGDAGVTVGAAYHFCCRAGVRPGPPGESLRHSFYCGIAPGRKEIMGALAGVPDVDHRRLGNVRTADKCERIADLLATIVSNDGVAGLYQGVAETGPRALGHRSILANPANRRTLDTLNRLVKFREAFRPLAPMATYEAAKRLFVLSSGAADDDHNAYNYMVLTARARPEAYHVIPAVIHRDGTSRVQIVRPDIDPFTHSFLIAMGRRIGAEVSVNTSLNVSSPIVQSPTQALEALKKSRGLDCLFLIGREGDAWVAWHNLYDPPKDRGARLGRWIREWDNATPERDNH